MCSIFISRRFWMELEIAIRRWVLSTRRSACVFVKSDSTQICNWSTHKGSGFAHFMPFHFIAVFSFCCKTARPMHCVWNMHANDNIYYLVWNENLLSLECLWVMFWCLPVSVCECESARANVWICLCVYMNQNDFTILLVCSRPILHKIYWWNCH